MPRCLISTETSRIFINEWKKNYTYLEKELIQTMSSRLLKVLFKGLRYHRKRDIAMSCQITLAGCSTETQMPTNDAYLTRFETIKMK